jgi:hypothetical protein
MTDKSGQTTTILTVYNQSKNPPKLVIRMGQMDHEARKGKYKLYPIKDHEGPEGEKSSSTLL